MDITVIIPVFNRANYIIRTLESIEHSTVLPNEVIIVDNGSTDDTVSVCEEYISNSPSTIFHIISENRTGAACARNRGLAECNTEWVFFFDSDDEMSNDFFESIVQLNSQNIDMIAFPTNMVVNGKSNVRAYRETSETTDQILSSMLNTESILFRTEFIRKIGGWNEQCKIWDDWELAIRALENQPRLTWYTKKAFHTSYVHEDSITGTSFTNSYKKIFTTLSIVSRYLKGKERKALYYHIAILLEKIAKEKHADKQDAINVLSSFVSKNFTPTVEERFVSMLLKFYTRLGGRGAWRIAILFCK